MPTADDWDRSYRDGRHAQLWDTPWPSPELAGALGLVPDRGCAVDLGCGTGSDAILMAQRGLEVVGVDVSPTALALAEAKARDAGVEVKWAVADVLQLPIRDATVDLATDRGCIHYLGDAEREQYAAELARALRPKGLLFLRGMAAPERHKTAVTDTAIRSVFAAPDFDVISTIDFTMLGAHKSAPATLAFLRRL